MGVRTPVGKSVKSDKRWSSVGMVAGKETSVVRAWMYSGLQDLPVDQIWHEGVGDESRVHLRFFSWSNWVTGMRRKHSQEQRQCGEGGLGARDVSWECPVCRRYSKPQVWLCSSRK